MTPSESLPVGIDGLALALESAAALVGALGLGIAAGMLIRARLGRRPPAPPIAPEPERELESLRRIAAELARTSDVEGVARALLDEIASLFRVGFVALAFVSDDASEASGFLARAGGKDVGWWRDLRLDLAREPSGIASAVYEASSFAVYDVGGSSRVSSRLAEETGAGPESIEPKVVANALMGVHRALLDFVRPRALAGVPTKRLAREVRAEGERALAVLARGLGDYCCRTDSTLPAGSVNQAM